MENKKSETTNQEYILEWNIAHFGIERYITGISMGCE